MKQHVPFHFSIITRIISSPLHATPKELDSLRSENQKALSFQLCCQPRTGDIALELSGEGKNNRA
jgi:hypothetical protein